MVAKPWKVSRLGVEAVEPLLWTEAKPASAMGVRESVGRREEESSQVVANVEARPAQGRQERLKSRSVGQGNLHRDLNGSIRSHGGSNPVSEEVETRTAEIV